MDSRMTRFREAVREAVGDLLDVRIVPGRFSGAQRNGPIGCIFPHGQGERNNVLEQALEVRLRIFLKYETPKEPLTLADPAPLEAIVERIQVALSAGDQSFAQSVWLARLVEAEYDMVSYGVEMAFVAVTWNEWETASPEA